MPLGVDNIRAGRVIVIDLLLQLHVLVRTSHEAEKQACQCSGYGVCATDYREYTVANDLGYGGRLRVGKILMVLVVWEVSL